MSRLPIPGSDEGTWGAVLNDFLLQSHSPNGSIKPNAISSTHLADGSVQEQTLANGAVSMTKLGDDVLDRLAAIEARLTSTAAARTLLGHALPAEENVSNNGNPLELAMRFSANVAGQVLGIRFYKSIANTGAHTGTLRQENGTPLKSVSFENESPAGWQTQLFDTPVAIPANTPYVVSYYSPTGNFSRSASFFNTPLYVQDLTAPAGTPEFPNGLYREGAGAPDMPAYQNSSYLVDIVFSPFAVDG